ncbi:MAG TPA: hypothetical protein VMR98_02305, partial [Candidatus Polarisedimenticolaceae bacterium]|nr:hypothetical protein [Candidatus Polarisedimenticolaceae bacterium]
GYGCPDGGGCNPKYAGFTRQVLWGSWQLKFNKERAYGNTGWDEDDAIQYVGYMTEGDRKRCGSCTLTHYDGVASIDGQGVYLQNGTTASLYTYTPHLGQAFPAIFEAWFGSSLSNANVSYAGQSTYPSLAPGAQGTGYIKYKNLSGTGWYDDTSIGSAPAGTRVVHLATSGPLNRASDFFGSGWATNNRPAATFGAVYESNGTTLAPNQHVAQNGQIVKFNITFHVPAGYPAGVYREVYRPIYEGVAGGGLSDPWTFMDVTVTPVYANAFSAGSSAPTLRPTESTNAFISYVNTGNVAWFDNLSVFSSPGSLPVHLATSHAINRSSLFGTDWGGDNNRPASVFGAVYESNGTTLASNQHVAGPGQIAKFNIPLKVPAQQAANTYREYFQPIVEGGSTMNDPATFTDVAVSNQPIAKFASSSSNNFTMNPGATSTLTLTFTNTGNSSWSSANVSLMPTNT